MARFYLDEMMSKLLVRALRDLDHDVISTRDLGQQHQPDYLQLLYCLRTNRILVTKDKVHFGELHGAVLSWTAEWKVDVVAHHGILLVPADARDDIVAQWIDELIQLGFALPNTLYECSARGDWQEVPLQELNHL